MHTYTHAYRYLNPVYIIYTHAYVKRNRGNAEEKKKKKRERGFYLNSFNVTKTNNAFMWVTCAKFNQMNTGRTYSQLPYITALLLTRRSTRTFGEIVKKDTARSEVKAATGWRLKIFNRKSPCVTLERKGNYDTRIHTCTSHTTHWSFFDVYPKNEWSRFLNQIWMKRTHIAIEKKISNLT